MHPGEFISNFRLRVAVYLSVIHEDSLLSLVFLCVGLGFSSARYFQGYLLPGESAFSCS
jgi:hypothetical protein